MIFSDVVMASAFTAAGTVAVGMLAAWPQMKRLRADSVSASLKRQEEERLAMAAERDALSRERQALIEQLRIEINRQREENDRQRGLNDAVAAQLDECLRRETGLQRQIDELKVAFAGGRRSTDHRKP